MIYYKKFDILVKDNPKIFVDSKEARTLFDKYLFHLIEIEDFNAANDKSRRHGSIDEILTLCPEVVNEVKIITPINEQEDSKNINENSDDELVIMRGFLEKLGFDQSKFTIEYCVKNYPNLKIDVMEQTNNFYGFSNNRHVRSQTTIKEYYEYINKRDFQKQEVWLKNKPNIIKYGVNIELDGIPEMKEELDKKFLPNIMYGSEYDILSYVRQNILGMTIPQLYIKTRGAWTGGHEENLRFKSININHGPGESLWFGVHRKYCDAFTNIVKSQYKMDIFSKEGHWFPDIYFFMKHKIPVFYTVQKGGDSMIVGPGCLHWVRAFSHSLNSSWNFGSKNINQLQSCMERYELNKTINFRSIVPMVIINKITLNLH